jgi:hypothetical protein
MRKTSIGCFGLLFSLSLVTTACDDGPPTDGTVGDYGRVSFRYQRSCFFGCPLEQPLLAGTREAIGLSDAGDVPGLKTASNNRNVAEFAVEARCYCEHQNDESVQVDIALDAECDAGYRKHCDNTVLVQANDAGDATLTLKKGDGQIIDSVEVHVREAKRAAVVAKVENELAPHEVDTLALKVNESVELNAALYDTTGKKLLAPEGVTWRVSSQDNDVAEVSAFLVAAGPEINASLDATLHAIAAGKGTLHIEVPGLDWTVPLTVKAE